MRSRAARDTFDILGHREYSHPATEVVRGSDLDSVRKNESSRPDRCKTPSPPAGSADYGGGSCPAGVGIG